MTEPCGARLTPRGRLTGSYIADHICIRPHGHSPAIRHRCSCSVEWDTITSDALAS